MRTNIEILHKAVELLEEGREVVFATIIECAGSVPRREGTKMLITAEGKTYGSIGGGVIEQQVIQLAKTALAEGKIIIEEFSFAGRESRQEGMICGGRVTVLIEPQQTAETLIICGAGHIGIAVHQICQLLGFNIIVIDDRAEFANQERFPQATKIIVASFESALSNLATQVKCNYLKTYFVICTRHHQSDQTCLELALKTPATYIGMLGSRTKWEQIKKNLLAKGVRKKDIQRVHCPIGLDIGAITPEEIAVSIAAEIIQHRAKCLKQKTTRKNSNKES